MNVLSDLSWQLIHLDINLGLTEPLLMRCRFVPSRFVFVPQTLKFGSFSIQLYPIS